ncbi:MAG: ERCC4 domain-containing protein [Desulfobacterales bacterium]|jgi:ERCC4-type nuclease
MGINDFPVTVIADDRERNSEVIQFLSKMKNVSVGVKRLSLGDYLADNWLVFERKTLNDFARSIVDGRLFRQTIRLASAKYKSVMILEGTAKDLSETGVSREAMQGALITISLLLGIPVLRSIKPFETACLILYAAKQIRSISKGVFMRRGYRPKGKRKKQLFVLQGLPGVGSERAARLLDAFGSVEAVVTANGEELQTVAGIGKHIAEKIRWAVSERIQAYGVSDEFPI